jgi:hypothetical protein
MKKICRAIRKEKNGQDKRKRERQRNINTEININLEENDIKKERHKEMR